MKISTQAAKKLKNTKQMKMKWTLRTFQIGRKMTKRRKKRNKI